MNDDINRTHTSMPYFVGRDSTGTSWYRRVVSMVDKDGSLVVVVQYSKGDLKQWTDVSTTCINDVADKGVNKDMGVRNNSSTGDST